MLIVAQVDTLSLIANERSLYNNTRRKRKRLSLTKQRHFLLDPFLCAGVKSSQKLGIYTTQNGHQNITTLDNVSKASLISLSV